MNILILLLAFAGVAMLAKKDTIKKSNAHHPLPKKEAVSGSGSGSGCTTCDSSVLCSYPAPPVGMRYIRGDDYDINTGCGLVLVPDAELVENIGLGAGDIRAELNIQKAIKDDFSDVQLAQS